MFAFTRILRQILLEHTYNDDIDSIHIFNSSAPITKDEGCWVFFMSSDRGNSFKESEISWFHWSCQNWNTLKWWTFWWQFPWTEVGLRQTEKHSVVHPLFYCHEFFAQFALEYIRLSCLQIRKAFFCVKPVIIHKGTMRAARSYFSLGSQVCIDNACVALPVYSCWGSLIRLLQLMLILRWWSSDWVVLFLLGWHLALAVANTVSACQGQHQGLQFP